MSWMRVREEFDALVELAEPARSKRLAQLESTDRELAGELRRLLRHDAEAPEFLERTPPPVPSDSATASGFAGRRLGRYELLRPLGSGGMGAVWEAAQREPARTVALKLVPRTARTESERWRFEHEVQVLALLNHPSIATFFEAGAGELDGREVSWLAMELVDGARDLLTWADEQQLGREQRLALFLRLCDAVDHGHRHGILHRDLKPSNALVGKDGQLKLIDFGIAKALGNAGADAPHTLTGAVVGTLQYMAPEQLRGDAAAVGTPSDVYALGVILYHLLCGRGPFDLAGLSLPRVALLVLERDPVPPLTAQPDLPPDLGWILVRALEKDPARRYPTARALIDDLERYRNHIPIEARPPSASYRLAKFARRNRVAVAISAALFAGITAGVLGLWRGMVQARESETHALRGVAMTQEVLRILVGLFNGVQDTQSSREMKVHELLDAARFDAEGIADPGVECAVREIRGNLYLRLGRNAEAAEDYGRALELYRKSDAAIDPHFVPEREWALQACFGCALTRAGEAERGEELLRGAVAAVEQGAPDAIRMSVLEAFCMFLGDRNLYAELEPRAAELATLGDRLGDKSMLARAENLRVEALVGLDRAAEVLPAAERGWKAALAAWGADNELTFNSLAIYLKALQSAGRFEEAEPLYPALLASIRNVMGPSSEILLRALNNQCEVYLKRGQRAQAIQTMREVVRAYDAGGSKVITWDHLAAINNFGMSLNQDGRFDEAEPVLRRAAELTGSVLDPRDPNGPMMRFNHAACLAWLKRWGEAEPILLAEYEALQPLLPAGHAVFGKARRTIADGYEANGFPERAAEWRSR